MAEKMFDIPTQLVLDKLASKHSFDEAAEEMQKSLDKVGVKLDLKQIRATLEEINNEMLRDINIIKKANEAADRERTERYRKMNMELQKLDETNAEHQARLWAVYDKERAKDYAAFLKDAEKGMNEYDKKMNKESLGEVQTMFAKPGGGMEKGGKTLTPRVGEVPIPEGGGGLAGKFGGMMGAGAAAGAVAGAVIFVGQLLVKAIGDMVKQSKIMSMLQDTWNKAMGLLMDLILIPFIPLLVYGIVKLFRAIMDFNKWWTSVWKTIANEGLLGILKLTMDLLMAANPFMWLWKVLKAVVTGDWSEFEPLLKLTIDLYRWLNSTGEWFMKPLLEWAFSAGAETGKTLKLTFNMLWGTVAGLLDQILGWAFGAQAGTGGKILQFLFDLFQMNPVFWAWDLVQALATGDFSKITTKLDLGLSIIQRTFDFISSLIQSIFERTIKFEPIKIFIDLLKGIGGVLWDLVTGAYKGVIEVKTRIPGFATGGIVPGLPGEPTLAIVHGGERVIPAGKEAGGGNNVTNYIYFQGLTNDQLPDKVRQIIRQDATRYTQ